MNLYRSFGNLLETWVADGIPSSDTTHPGIPPAPSGPRLPSEPHMGIVTLRSESEDSGVELACSEASLLSPCCSLPLAVTDTDPAYISPCAPLSPVPSSSSSSSSSSSFSSSPLCLGPSRPLGGSGPLGAKDFSMVLHLKVERALQRTEGWKDPQSAGDDAISRRRTHTASLPRDPTVTTTTTGQRSGSVGPRRAGSQQGSETRRRPMSLYHNPPAAQIGTQDPRGEEWVELSPGLSYLEQVCRLLEEIARLQQKNCGLQTEMDALREDRAQQERQTSASLLCDCQDLSSNQREAVKDLSSNQRDAVKDLSSNQTHGVKGLQRVSSETQFLDETHHQTFRCRSASDTKVLTGHLGKMKSSTRGQHASKDELLEQKDGWRNQGLQQDEHDKSRMWRFKLSSLRRDPAPQSDSYTNRQQIHSSGIKASGHRLSQLFRSRRKTLPA